MKKAIYLRVSKKELNEKTQLPVILKAFGLKEEEIILLYDKLSGYKEESQEKRTGMNKLIELVESQQISEVYVYSLERFYRNIDWLMRFYFTCRTNDVEVFSYLQPEINTFSGGKPIDTFLKYQSVLVNGFMGQQESYLISQRTKKSFVKDKNGVKKSYKGNKLGRKTNITEDDIEEIINMSDDMSYREIKDALESEGKEISLGYISKIVRGSLEE